MAIQNNAKARSIINNKYFVYTILRQNHEKLEMRLRDIDKIRCPTNDEKIERKKIKKYKLLIKNKMAYLLSRWDFLHIPSKR